ncbi:MAG TPA: HD domain-containing protein, partial [Candidatus Thermoplasmatota archaeon]|nr:HD domain-containing protein [Candidatus Thermoplasmatota archaeon]
MKRVRDPIHDYIPLDAAALAIVDRPEFQRLRRIRQLGTAALVYPGANHARFEHSLGAQHVARLACEAIGLKADDALEVRLAALLHDVGHGPFSHLTDNVMRDLGGFSHAEVSAERARTTFSDALAAHGADPKRVAELVRGRGALGELVASDLDVDRMDYIVRDAHYTGVDVGVDLGRLVHEMRLTPKGVALSLGALQAAEMLLVTRYMMYTTVYLHPTCRVGEV